ncbi:WD40 repeat domain-containing protein [Cryptosporangium japonicum]|uniref:Uncharacterized protein n=1 Tax=Cryptosporangium japonicum TaxID=80872 RepID=A0ABN0TN90_9ACTN
MATRTRVGPPLTGHANEVWSIVFSPDGSLLASGSKDKSVRVHKVF